ncbi:hypothetical protein PUW24_19810 [Paenibacillus urinalis]|uniref:DUF2178 domain-containing protein n=1 Tax=Paenibacillus urinalis TaxID=521520 RepID=A0ABY7XFP7_9BACL|nr:MULTISPECIES: hypothetical protein [Paenibacillus]WDH96399.1 hypothetical protein PUW24_19810 [Paenibacillus urinalis]WDI04621.1 hypothetical protein PUW25_11970 [Paenibacillus urinalis]GAK40526.1 hypothetical protein TCA2_3016 [Paenibacillus sp. TCA20]
MEKYKIQVTTRKNALLLIAAAMLLIYAGLVFYRGGLPELPSFIKGFHTGAFIGVELCIVFFLVKYRKASKNEAELKKLYIEENDERNAVILQSASSLSMVIILVGLGMASVIAGFFNTMIFYTLMAALFFVLIVFFVLWIYFAKKI